MFGQQSALSMVMISLASMICVFIFGTEFCCTAQAGFRPEKPLPWPPNAGSAGSACTWVLCRLFWGKAELKSDWDPWV